MGLTYGLIALSAVLGAFTVALFSRVRALSSANERLRGDYDGAREQIRELAEKERKASAKLDERTREAQQLKKDLGAQKKKAFETSERIKGLEADLKAAKDSALKAANQRPAFADEPKAKPELPQKPAEPAVPDLRGELAALEERASGLEAEKQALAQKVREAEGELKKARGEVRKAKRRVDEYRRADQVARSRSELTDDKVRYLSRQYYEAVSELAALKGEVAPPPPRELEELRRGAAQVERAPVRAASDTDSKNASGASDRSNPSEPENDEADAAEPAEEVTSA